ncbi:RING-H2 finger protein atl52 [Phtheirospermum japonicum]|uniref:RING-type E3 ubiquitin transferase n=1 Tax=Phtheirospermum japonicum TaxID=374723 RepID=A0A830BF00_9LAMI|nr:RING-H2 finger protein atl52 [Phtheirospermum japonicum]
MESINSPPMPKSSSNSGSISNPLLISMLGIVGTSLAIVFYHMLLVKYCIRRHGSTATPPRSTVSGGASAGVDEKVLRKIQISAFSAVRGDGADIQDECVVCLGEIEDEDDVRLLPGCEHVFHVTCIDRWFVAHASCPVCRSPIVEPANVDPMVDADRESGGECSTTDGGGGEEAVVASLPRAQSDGLLRHCASMMVVRPPAAERRSSPPRLKRSLSMDQVFVAIGLRCSGDILARSGSYSTRSNLRHLDRVSSKLRRSFSRLRVEMAGGGAILPY